MSRRRQRERGATRQGEAARGRTAGFATTKQHDQALAASRDGAPVGTPASRAARRVPGVDALRGGAIVLMVAYHFCFDLRYYRVISADFEHDPFWLGFRALIVTSFMLLVGMGLVLAARAGAGMSVPTSGSAAR